MDKLRTLVLIYSMFYLCSHGYAQQPTTNFQLAQEYLSNREYEKAKSSLSKIAKSEKNTAAYHELYVTILKELQQIEQLTSFLKKQSKKFPDNYYYFIDYQHQINSFKNKSSEKKAIQNLLAKWSDNKAIKERIADYLNTKKQYSTTINYINQTRSQSNPTLGVIQIANAHQALKDPKNYYKELITWLVYEPTQIEQVKQIVQEKVVTTETEKLEEQLYYHIQKNPETTTFNKFLIWYYIQKRSYTEAFTQAKSLDKRKQFNPQNLFSSRQLSESYQVAKSAEQARQYIEAISMYQYLITQSKNRYEIQQSKKGKLYCKEQLIKNTYPIDSIQVQSLINEYIALASSSINKNEKATYYIKSADYSGNYLGDLNTAKKYLEKVNQMPNVTWQNKAEAKIALADIYLLRDEPWESVLLYYQAEKISNDTDIAHRAKLKNALLSYYQADFELAKDRLNILKRATTRKISNDAIDLYIHISNNLSEDTTGKSLAAYAAVEKLLFQHKYNQALTDLDKIKKLENAQFLEDEILWLKAKINIQKREINSAIKYLEQLISVYNNKALEDDAIFLLAQLYDQDLNNIEKAQENYKKIMLDYPSSIFVSESRKRFREIRGN
ncbi:MAG: hypothetical protein AB8B61_01945 [Cyclobacteriaceae bacterium]